MKTFLPVISANNNHSETKSWRTSPAIHMWRGYPHALGVYLYINCRVWASRKSTTTGKPFSNDKMDEHIKTYNFGKNEQGKLVFSMESDEEEKDEEAEAKAEAAEENKVELPDAVSAAANDAFAPVPAAAAAGSSAPTAAIAAAAGVPVAAAAAAAADAAPARPGTYVDGIRIPWWFHSKRIHDSDAAVLYRKDPAHYKSFKPHSKKHETYVWPRDIDPNHPEQKVELDALAAIIAKEQAAKLKAKEDGSKKSKKPKQSVSDDSEGMDEQSADEAEAGPSAASSSAAAASSTPFKKRRVSSSSPVAVSDLSPAGTPLAVAAASPTVRIKRSRAASAASSASSTLAAAAAAESSPSKRAKKSDAAESKPKAKKKIQL